MMIRILLIGFCFLLSVPTISTAQKSVDRFINKHLDEDNTLAIRLPGWLFSKSMKWASRIEDDEELASYSKLASYVKNVRVFAIEEDSRIPISAVKDLIDDMQDNEDYEEYMTIRHEETNVNLFVREDGKTIRNMVFLVNAEDDAFALIQLKLKMPYEAFKELYYALNDK